MNWITNFVKPKIQALINRKDSGDNLWTKCPSCEHMLFQRDLKKAYFVCHHCQHHMLISPKERFDLLFDENSYKIIPAPKVFQDPLKFKDTKKYTDRLKEYRDKTSDYDSVLVAYGTLQGQPLVVSVFNFSFMGGSMGIAAGEAFVKGAEIAIKEKTPYLVVTASGGARMQEGALSLMQMPKTVVAVELVKEAGLPYLTLLTHPTMGGVTASFAMLGDINIGEEGAVIGFTGARVIEETIRQKLPDNFQRSEYLQEHGMLDMVIHRKELKEKLSQLISLIMQQKNLKKKKPHKVFSLNGN